MAGELGRDWKGKTGKEEDAGGLGLPKSQDFFLL